MDFDPIAAISLSIQRGDAALWLGPNWVGPSSAAEADRIARVDWIAVWLESFSAGFVPGEGQAATPSGRLMIEVPDHIEDVLGEHFSVAEVCPFFYLKGKEPESDNDPLSLLQRRRSRDRKVDHLSKLGPGALLVNGYEAVESLRDVVVEFFDVAPECRLVVLLGVDDATRDSLLSTLPAPLASRVVGLGATLIELLDSIDRRREQLPVKPTVRVGSDSIVLERLLRTEPPLDQEFAILTEQFIRDPDADEPQDQLFIGLLSGIEPPWRAFAHNLDWNRTRTHREEVRREIREFAQGAEMVRCINIPAEPGSGLTVLLQQIGFDAARAGIPVLIHRGDSALNYDLLRTFLTSIQASNGRSVGPVPAMLIFDAPSVEADNQGWLRALPARLSRDSRRAFVVRGIPAFRGTELNQHDAEMHDVKRHHGSVTERWLRTLPNVLDSADQDSLLNWASDHLERLGHPLPSRSTELIRNWDSGNHDVPLLIFLYSILSGELRDAAALGRHLVDRLRTRADVEPSADDTFAADTAVGEPLTGATFTTALVKLRAGLGGGRRDSDKPTMDDIATTFMLLSALGCLRLGMPRRVLADVSEVEPSMSYHVVAELERCDLASTSIAPPNDRTSPSRHDGPLAPLAFYTSEERVGLRHPAYGQIVLDWLNREDSAADHRLLDSRRFATEFLSSLGPTQSLNRYPLEFLEPVFSRLRPTRDHVAFAEEVAMKYLRLQKGRHHEDLSRWQWSNRPLLLKAFDWLPPQVIQQSASLLHSRGITRYKSCHSTMPLDEARGRYDLAKTDFERGLQLARQGGSERPINIITSLGLMYLGWMDRERTEGNEVEWRELDRKVEETLRDAMLTTPSNNPYAVFGLSQYLVSRYERTVGAATEESVRTAAASLAEAIELLQREPEPHFETEWTELRAKAIGLLSKAEAAYVIDKMQRDGDELGFSLDALRILGGRIPTEPTAEPQEVKEIKQAAEVLLRAQQANLSRRCNLAQLLRYALFSSSPERLAEPAYQVRHDMIAELAGTRFLDEPVWLFDYAMLSFQVGKYADGSEAFSRLRKGQRFFDVSRDRGCVLTQSVDSLEPLKVFLRVVSTEGADTKGWGRVEHPVRFRDPVPFSVRVFRSRGKKVDVGSTVTCFVRLNPAGPFAEPA